MTRFSLKDSGRIIEFNGKELANATSRQPYSPRWIEFTLYRTEQGTYILHRIGVSRVFHTGTCGLVGKYGLHETGSLGLAVDSEACEDCRPSHNDPILYAEEDRLWTLTTRDPRAVVDALYRVDRNSGARYFTRVARTLVEAAADADAEIDQAYRAAHGL